MTSLAEQSNDSGRMVLMGCLKCHSIGKKCKIMIHKDRCKGFKNKYDLRFRQITIDSHLLRKSTQLEIINRLDIIIELLRGNHND